MTILFYKDRKKEWRWTLTAKNGRKVACSGEGYKRRLDAMKEARKILRPGIKLAPPLVGVL